MTRSLIIMFIVTFILSRVFASVFLKLNVMQNYTLFLHNVEDYASKIYTNIMSLSYCVPHVTCIMASLNICKGNIDKHLGGNPRSMATLLVSSVPWRDYSIVQICEDNGYVHSLFYAENCRYEVVGFLVGIWGRPLVTLWIFF